MRKIMIKKCNQCNKEFIITEKEIVYCSNSCRNKHTKIQQKYREEHIEIIKQKTQQYYQKNREVIKEKSKKYRKEHKQYIKLWKQKNYLKNKIKILSQMKIYRQNHKPEAKEYAKKYNKENRKQLNKYIRKYLENPLKLLIARSRNRMWSVLKGKTKSDTTKKLIGCSIEDLKKHLERQFTKGMSWSNWGRGWNNKGKKQWHVDHIIPCASFDLRITEQQKICFNYSNLQPLWAEDNLRKNKY
jgi:hypothetical protein